MQLLSLLLLASLSLAAPAPAPASAMGDFCHKGLAIKDLAGLPVPQKPVSFVLLGVGTQNYTCSTTGTYATAGAVAKLYDVSCLSKTPVFPGLTSLAYSLWNKAHGSTSVSDAIFSLLNNVDHFGDHYFVTNPSGSGITPKWDATSGAFKGNQEAFMLGMKAVGVAAPTGTSDVDWLYLTNVGGSLADGIYRMSTRGGQPPASCTAGQSTTVKYTSFYYVTGGKV